MEVFLTERENNLVVRLKGEFDLHTADYFKAKLKDKLNKSINNLILNLDSIKFIDSSGLGAILSKYKEINKQGGDLVITNVTPQVERIFELSGILNIIDIYSSEKEALDNITGR